MAEFSRVQLIVQEDVRQGLMALRSDLQASSTAFIADVRRIVDVPMADPRSALFEASLERFRRQATLKFDLPLAKMDAAAVDIMTFLNARLQELGSQSKLPNHQITRGVKHLFNTFGDLMKVMAITFIKSPNHQITRGVKHLFNTFGDLMKVMAITFIKSPKVLKRCFTPLTRLIRSSTPYSKFKLEVLRCVHTSGTN